MVFAEVKFVADRINARTALETSLLQQTLSAIPNQSVKASATKKAAANLAKILKELLHGNG